ncbi:sensor histidine kinase [Hamadaea tsunoensis]|uniref:sensor histidine kinase n=1 Tax=Hamadaea tsunoensis TaxID=53368 RepID=UPI0004291B1C|nr:sensor histidine kinase [Hamadaea tsunoensis]
MNLLAPFMTAEERRRLSKPLTLGELRKRRLVGLIWSGVWAFPLVSQADDVVRATSAPWLALPLFVAYLALYLFVVMKGFARRELLPSRIEILALFFFAALGVSLALGFTGGTNTGALVTLLYVGVAGMATFPAPAAYYWLAGTVVIMVVIGVARHDTFDDIGSVVFNAVLAAALVMVVRNMIRLIRELDSTRTRLAQSAVEQERLRFARDLHDLLGHTLSLIVVKAEVARRLAERDPAATAREAGEIEQIGRKALAEVREAVTGYRERCFSEELENARGALADAGVEVVVRRVAADLPADVDQAFAWVVREATTNVIKHSGARTCRIMLENGSAWSLTVRDDGRGRASASDEGNGLRGLRERLTKLGGALSTSDAGGFALQASVPSAKETS